MSKRSSHRVAAIVDEGFEYQVIDVDGDTATVDAPV